MHKHDKVEKYYIISCHVLWREITHYASLSKHIFNFKFLEQGLHDTPDTLRTEVQKAIDEVDGDGYSAILLGYGLCSNGISGITAGKTRLAVVRGHDCITHLLGSKERYREFFDKNPGTYWYSPGWIETSAQPGKERYEKTRNAYIEKYGEDNAEYLMQMEQNWFNEYSNAAYVDLGFDDTSRHKKFTKECATWLKWNYVELKGDPALLIKWLDGRWDSEDFLIVEPGETIVPSNDDKIIKISKK